MKILIIAILILILTGYIYLRATSTRRFRNGQLIGRRGMEETPRTQRGNKCTCLHGKKVCNKPVERRSPGVYGVHAQQGLCKHCRIHGPRGRDRTDPDEE